MILQILTSFYNMKTEKTLTDKECTRCGICCKKGGPSFHLEDKHLIETGVIHSKFLYTIREGEPAWDNIIECLVPLETDIIKLKGKGDSWTCIFFDETIDACTIYEHRPLECRTLKCWDTSEIELVYSMNRLTREDLLAEIEGLWELIKSHQERCNYAVIQDLVAELEHTQGGKARRKLGEVIKFDQELRKLVIAQGVIDQEMLAFLFGRPVTESLKAYGLSVRQQGDKMIIAPVPNFKGRLMGNQNPAQKP